MPRRRERPDAWPTMTPDELRAARAAFDLTREQWADVLETTASAVKKMETPAGMVDHRAPPDRVVQLIQAYLQGYRPNHWPAAEEKKT